MLSHTHSLSLIIDWHTSHLHSFPVHQWWGQSMLSCTHFYDQQLHIFEFPKYSLLVRCFLVNPTWRMSFSIRQGILKLFILLISVPTMAADWVSWWCLNFPLSRDITSKLWWPKFQYNNYHNFKWWNRNYDLWVLVLTWPLHRYEPLHLSMYNEGVWKSSLEMVHMLSQGPH